MSISRTLVAVLSVAVAALAVPAWRHWSERPPAPPAAARLTWSLPDDLPAGAGSDYPFGLAVSPDGRRVVFPAAPRGRPQLWMRDLAYGETTALPDTNAAVLPFWAPDGRRVGFFADGRVMHFAFEAGRSSPVAEARAPGGALWLPNGDIVFAPDANAPLYRRDGDTGEAAPFTTLDTAAGETAHRHPVMLGDRHVVFFVAATGASRQGLWIAPIATPANRVRLTGTRGAAIAAADWVLFASDDVLIAQPVEGLGDGETPRLGNRSVVIGSPVGIGPIGQLFAAAGGDLLIYGAAGATLRELRWFDRQGGAGAAVGASADAFDLRLAPNGRTIAATQTDPQLGTLDVFVFEGANPVPRRISPTLDADESVVWSPDGTRLVWVSGGRSIRMRSAQAELAEHVVRTFERPVLVWDWAANGDLLIGQSANETRQDLWVLPTTGGEPRVYAAAPFNEGEAAVSPDARWVAYASDESGAFEIYVDSYPRAGNRTRLTNGGGNEPRWARNGRELYFRRGREIHALTLTQQNAALQPARSAQLFSVDSEIRSYDAAPDGSRFLLNVRAAGRPAAPPTAIVNWRSLLRP